MNGRLRGITGERASFRGWCREKVRVGVIVSVGGGRVVREVDKGGVDMSEGEKVVRGDSGWVVMGKRKGIGNEGRRVIGMRKVRDRMEMG